MVGGIGFVPFVNFVQEQDTGVVIGKLVPNLLQGRPYLIGIVSPSQVGESGC
jgi:hypothetical protein